MRPRVLKAIAATMFREYWRTPEAIFWTYCFPILMAVALGVAFGSDEKAPLPIVVEESTGQDGSGDEPWLVKLRQDPRLSVETAPNAEAAEGYRRGRYLAWIQREEGRPRIVVDPARPDTELVRLVVARALAPPRAEGLRVVTLNAPGSRYIDWLIPGLIGLNLLGAGLWGIGFNLVQMRIGNTLRRLMVTPMGRAEFLLAFMLSRLVLVVPEAA
ncbi:MAG: ABC transporter permease, partial [Myxococcota bacterium]